MSIRVHGTEKYNFVFTIVLMSLVNHDKLDFKDRKELFNYLTAYG